MDRNEADVKPVCPVSSVFENSIEKTFQAGQPFPERVPHREIPFC